MPRKVTAYACKYKCGQKVVMSKQVMMQHEKTCKLNPDRRACATCKHEYNDDDFGYYCAEERIPEGKVMVYDCPYHALRKGLAHEA